jgi:glucose-6-phosphate 1-dehydrogenase
MNKLLPDQFAVVGVSRDAFSHDECRKKLRQDIRQFATVFIEPLLWKWLEQRLYYLGGNFQDPNLYTQLQNLLAKIDEEYHTNGNHCGRYMGT